MKKSGTGRKEDAVAWHRTLLQDTVLVNRLLTPLFKTPPQDFVGYTQFEATGESSIRRERLFKSIGEP